MATMDKLLSRQVGVALRFLRSKCSASLKSALGKGETLSCFVFHFGGIELFLFRLPGHFNRCARQLEVFSQPHWSSLFAIFFMDLKRERLFPSIFNR